MKTCFIKYFLVATSIITFFFIGEANAQVIDFQGLGFYDEDPVGTIGLATFEANASIKGSSYAFITSSGGGTGNSPPFSLNGNVFITNPGGVWSSETVKIIRIIFAIPISNLSFYVADIDSSLPTIEQLKAEIFNGSGESLNTITHTAPTGGENGDGEVTFINFGNISGIKRVVITLQNIGTNSTATAIGFGLDNIEFTIPPSVNDIIAFIDDNEDIVGIGAGNSATNKYNAFMNMLLTVADLIEAGDVSGACGLLNSIMNKCDGSPNPPDFIDGDADTMGTLTGMLDDLKTSLGCD